MNRDDILERSRKENQKLDEREREATARAGQMAAAVGGLICGIIILLESIFAEDISLSTWAVYLSMTGTTLLVKYFKLKKKHELIFGLFQLFVAAVFLIMYTVRLAG